MRRRGRWIVLGAVLALVALHGAAWLWATERLRAGYAAWAGAMRGAGWTVRSEAPRGAGWPLAAELVIPDALVADSGALVPGGIAWTAERVRLRLSPLAPWMLGIVPEGVQHVRLAALPEVAVTATALAASVPLGAGASDMMTVEGRAVRVAAAGGVAEAATLRAWLTPDRLRAEAGEIALPRSYAWPLGATITAASATVAMVGGMPGPIPPGATAAQGAAQEAARWRDAGGRVDVPSFALRWGPLGASGSGTGTLDEALQPRAEATVRLEGWQAALDRLVQGGAVTPGAALAARAALGLFGRASTGTPPGSVTLPMLLRAGTLDAGGIPLLRVPPLAW